MTSAPMSPSICVARGPATTEVRSRTRMPANGPAMVDSALAWSRLSGELWYHFLGEQPHRFLRFGEIEGAEIDLQRGVLEFADDTFEAADGGFDLVGRADPGAAGFDLGFQRKVLHPADRDVVALVVLRRRALGPFAGGFEQRGEIILELPTWDFAGKLCVLVAEHVERDH